MRKGIFVLVLILLAGVVSAHGTYWNMDGGAALSYEKIENLNRFPVESYRLGYSYRATDEFKERHEIEKPVYLRSRVRCGDFDNKDFGRNYYDNRKGGWDKKRPYDLEKSYYYKWIPSSRRYERVECYRSAPAGKFIYRKCP